MKLPQDFSNDPLKDATMGMTNAEKNMEIPMVLYPEDMVGEADGKNEEGRVLKNFFSLFVLQSCP